MVSTITQNFYLNGSKFRDFCTQPPPSPQEKTNYLDKAVTDVTVEVGQAVKEIKKPSKAKFKIWIVVAAWVVAMAIGIALSVFGGITANHLMAKFGTFIVMGLAGIGIKVFQKAFEQFDKD